MTGHATVMGTGASWPSTKICRGDEHRSESPLHTTASSAPLHVGGPDVEVLVVEVVHVRHVFWQASDTGRNAPL